jgi:hypothetical protein
MRTSTIPFHHHAGVCDGVFDETTGGLVPLTHQTVW